MLSHQHKNSCMRLWLLLPLISGGMKRSGSIFQGFSWRRVLLIVGTVYVPAAVHMCPAVFLSRVINNQCFANIDLTRTEYLIEFTIFVSTDLIIPSTVMCYCYMQIAITLRRSTAAFSVGSSSGGTFWFKVFHYDIWFWRGFGNITITNHVYQMNSSLLL